MLILSFLSTEFIRTSSNYVSAGNTFLRLEGRKGAPCAIFEDHLECGIPEGVGLTSTLYLTAEYTTSFGTDTTFDIFQLDSFSYAGPNIFNISGCPEDGCDRRGNDTIEIRGTNFGMFDALVFVNREMCTYYSSAKRENFFLLYHSLILIEMQDRIHTRIHNRILRKLNSRFAFGHNRFGCHTRYLGHARGFELSGKCMPPYFDV